MKRRFEILFRDRATGTIEREKVFAEGFLFWLYNEPLGRIANALFFRRRAFSKLYGCLMRRPASRRRIPPFIATLDIDMSESTRPAQEFASFRDFFVREIDTSKHPIHPGAGVCVAPCDGKVLAYPVFEASQPFRVKGHSMDLRRCLGDPELAQRFDDGALVVSRLALRDDHHFHFPDSGIPGEPRAIAGRLDAGGPYALRRVLPFFDENFRMVTMFDSDHLGTIAMIEIGAMTVGSIQQCFQPRRWVAKGERKGWFEPGGSTVVLVFERGTIILDADLRADTERGIEVFVRKGDRIGQQPVAGGR
jgi:phosphatidylserine decarboxylase